MDEKDLKVEVSKKQCAALCRYGAPCLNNAKDGEDYCWKHLVEDV